MCRSSVELAVAELHGVQVERAELAELVGAPATVAVRAAARVALVHVLLARAALEEWVLYHWNKHIFILVLSGGILCPDLESELRSKLKLCTVTLHPKAFMDTQNTFSYTGNNIDTKEHKGTAYFVKISSSRLGCSGRNIPTNDCIKYFIRIITF